MNDFNSIINRVSEISKALKKLKREGLISNDSVDIALSLEAGVFEEDCWAAATFTVSCLTKAVTAENQKRHTKEQLYDLIDTLCDLGSFKITDSRDEDGNCHLVIGVDVK